MKNNEYIPKFNSVFKNDLLEFIKYKRNIGYFYNQKVCNIFEILDNFFVKKELQEKVIDNFIIEEWLKLSVNCKIRTRQNYFSAIKMFTEFLVIKRYDNITIPQINPYRGKSDFIPYIYTKEEIKNIFEKSKKYDYLFVILHLLYNCGLRIGEVLNLQIEHLDKINKTLLIKESKNNKTRLIPLTDDIFNVLNSYIKAQNLNSDDIFIFSHNKKRKSIDAHIRYIFHKVQKEADILSRENGFLPRIHDLRHTFAVHALEQMQNKGFDLYTSLPILSVYLGHKSIIETEYYLRFVPEYSERVLTSKKYVPNLYIEKEFYHEQ